MPPFLNPFIRITYGLFPSGNVRVTHSASNQSRSESEVAINPLNHNNIVGASKKFTDPSVYHFHLATYFSFDGGASWNESSLPLLEGWDGMTDPTLTFDKHGNVFLIGEPLQFGNDLIGLGMYVYKSTDGGQTWQQPIKLSEQSRDDKQWITSDDRHESPFFGNLYGVFGVGNCGFSRSTDGGNTWKGAGNENTPSYINFDSYAPAIVTDSKGWIHIFNIAPTIDNESIGYIRSKDGGETFETAKQIAFNISGLENLPNTDGWPMFPHGHFRTRTMVCACTGINQTLIIAWPDMREGYARIYYKTSQDGGDTWLNTDSGVSLLPNVSWGNTQCFMPQLTATANGTVGCTFYAFGKSPYNNDYLIDVYLAASYNNGNSFDHFVKVTDNGWNPLINAPFSHGDSNVGFIGDYFGITGTDDFFIPFWTDTRTGVQEIFCDVVVTKRTTDTIPEIVATLVSAGVMNDGGGFIIVNGKFIRVPPRSPELKILEGLSVIESSKVFEGRFAQGIKNAAIAALQHEIGNLEKGYTT